MIKILMVCHGNICRSTMAEYVMKDLVRKAGLEDEFYIDSAATSREEIGNPIHRGTVGILRRYGIPFDDHRAVQITKADYDKYDYILTMDDNNIRNAMRIFGSDPENKVRRLLDYTDRPGSIADPWYSGDFEATYADVLAGCQGLLDYLRVEKLFD